MVMEAQLHPKAADKMTWSDVSYLPHPNQLATHNPRPLIGLFGAYQRHVRDIEPLIYAIKALPEYDFIIRGDGDLQFDVSDIKNLDLSPGRISLNEVEALEDKCNILLSLGGKSGITHPAGKTFYYADYNKPIIHIGDGVNAEYFKKYLDGFEGRFIHCFNSKDDIVSAIERTVNQLKSFKLHIPQRMDAAVIAQSILEL